MRWSFLEARLVDGLTVRAATAARQEVLRLETSGGYAYAREGLSSRPSIFRSGLQPFSFRGGSSPRIGDGATERS